MAVLFFFSGIYTLPLLSARDQIVHDRISSMKEAEMNGFVFFKSHPTIPFQNPNPETHGFKIQKSCLNPKSYHCY